MDNHLDLHCGQVRQADDRLPLADGGPFLDLNRAAAATGAELIGVDDHAIARGRDGALLQLGRETLQPCLLQIAGGLLGAHPLRPSRGRFPGPRGILTLVNFSSTVLVVWAVARSSFARSTANFFASNCSGVT